MLRKLHGSILGTWVASHCPAASCETLAWAAPEQDAVLALPMDVEELGRLGRRKGTCPYYAARAALPEADLVLLPYSALLLQASVVLMQYTDLPKLLLAIFAPGSVSVSGQMPSCMGPAWKPLCLT
jgi:hypothetical protein